MHMKIKILSDSTCDLSKEILAANDVTLMPLTVIRDGSAFLDNVTITPAEIFAHVAAGGDLCSTTAVSIGEYIDFFTPFAAEYEGVVHINLGSGFSSTHQNACLAAEEFDNVVAIKEASGNISQMDEIIKNKPQDFDVISGDDGITFPLITLGAVGVISVIGNALPYEFSRMVRLALRGEYPQALEIHHRFTELFKLLFVDGNPAGVKALLSEMGLIQNELRLPLVPARLGTEKRISELATELGIRI